LNLNHYRYEKLLVIQVLEGGLILWATTGFCVLLEDAASDRLSRKCPRFKHGLLQSESENGICDIHSSRQWVGFISYSQEDLC